MNADLTFNSVAFKKSYDTKDESLRRSTTRDISTPDDLTVRTQDYVDSVTKVPGTRKSVRVDRWDVDANGTKYCTSIYVVLQVPNVENSTDLGVALATFKAAVADANLLANVLNGEL
jgi:hypothetical protein